MEVDTSRPLSLLPGSVLRGLGISPAMTRNARLPDGNRMEIDVGYASLKLDDHEAMTHFVFADENCRPSLGRVAINSLLLEYDAAKRMLIPMTSFTL